MGEAVSRGSRSWRRAASLAALVGLVAASTIAVAALPAAAVTVATIEVQVGDGSPSFINLSGWSDGVDVTLQVDRGDDGTIELSQTLTTPTFFTVDPPVAPGDRVSVSGDGVTKELVVEPLRIEYTNSESNVVAGTAPAGRVVEVIADPWDTRPTLFATADLTGHWSAGFTGTFDITENDPSAPATSAASVSARLGEVGPAADGDATTDNRSVDRAFINVFPSCCGSSAIIQNASWGWRPGTVLTVDVDRGDDGTVDFHTVVTYDGWNHELAIIAPLAVGDVVRVSGGGWDREVVVVPMTIGALDPAADVVSGSAPAGATVTVELSTPGVPGPPNATVATTADGAGHWSVDTTATYDIVGGNQASAWVGDADGDRVLALRFPGGGGPYLDLTPDTGLAAGDLVTLTGAAWPQDPAGRILVVSECALAYGLSASSCDTSTTRSITLNPDGTVPEGTTFTVAQPITVDLPSPGSTYDCVALGCGIVGVVWPGDLPNSGYPESLDQPGNNVLFPAPPPPVPHVTVTPPPSGATDGGYVTVELSGYYPLQSVQIQQCGPQAPAPANPFGVQYTKVCQVGLPLDQPLPQTDASGSASVQFQTTRYLIGNGQYAATPNTDLAGTQDVTVAGSGYSVTDCSTDACTIEAVMQGFSGTLAASDTVLLSSDATQPALVVRENFAGQDYGVAIVPWLTGGAIEAPLTDGDGDGSFDFSVTYTVHRMLTVEPEVAVIELGNPVGGAFAWMTNPIDCATLEADIVAHGVSPRPDPSSCLIDARPPRTQLGFSGNLQFTLRVGNVAMLTTGFAYPPSHDTYLEFATLPSQTITFGPLADKTFGDHRFNVKAKASSGLPVSFSVTADSAGVCTSSGPHGQKITIVGVGVCTVQADQAGDASWAPAAPVQQSFTVGKADQTIKLGPLPDRRLRDKPFTVKAHASSGLPVDVSVTASSAGVCTSSGLNGSTITIVGTGTCTVQADQPGDSNHNPAPPVQQSFVVRR